MSDTQNPKKYKGLGRGLNALFEDEEHYYPAIQQEKGDGGASLDDPRRKMVGIEQLHAGEMQPRRHFDEKALSELAESIKTHGLLQPLVVRKDQGAPDRYEIIAGERRWRASQIAQLHEVPVVVLELSDVQALEIALIENLQREDLSPVEEALGYKKLMDQFGHTQEKLAEALGKSRSHIANMVRLLNLPDSVLGYVQQGKLSAGHARALVPADNPETLAQDIIAKNLNVRDTEKLIAQGRPASVKKKSAAGSSKDPNIKAFEDELSQALGLKVSIKTSGKSSGVLSIEYKTLDQMDMLAEKLTK